MRSSEALKKARDRIAAGKNTYVCIAIEDSGGRHTAVYRNLQALFHNTSVESWLNTKSKEFRKFARSGQPMIVPMMRDYRLRWIDWMIPQYEAAGD